MLIVYENNNSFLAEVLEIPLCKHVLCAHAKLKVWDLEHLRYQTAGSL